MKLHLPKQLFSALLTAITLAAAPLALTLGSNAWGGWSGNTYFVDGNDQILTSSGNPASGNGVDNILFLKPTYNEPADATATIQAITLDNSGKTLVITGDWNQTPNFTALTINQMTVSADNTSLKIGYHQSSNVLQTVTIQKIDGDKTLTNLEVTQWGNLTIGTATLSSVTNAGTLTLGAEDNTTNTFTLGGAITNSGTLTLNGNTTATAGISGSGELVVSNSSTLTFELSSNSQNINTNIRIKDGSKMEFLDNSYDNLNYGNNSRTIYLEGTGELALGNTRQTVGYWTFDMTGGTISGNGTSGKLDFHRDGYINVHAAEGDAEGPTISTISAAINTKEKGALHLNVDANAQLELTNTLTLGRPTIKTGAGEAIMSGTVSMADLDVQTGTLKLEGTTTSSGQITVESGASLVLDGSATLTISKTVLGDITAAEGSTAKVLINTGNLSAFNHVLDKQYGSNGASGFWSGYQIYGAGSDVAVYSTTDTNTQITLVDGVYGVPSTQFDVNDDVVYNAEQMSSATQFNVSSTGSLDLFTDNFSSANITNKGEVLIAGTDQLAKVTNSENGIVYLLGEDGQQLLMLSGNFDRRTLNTSISGNEVTTSAGGNFNGKLTVLSGTTLKAGATDSFGAINDATTINVQGGATLDVNGESNWYSLSLEDRAVLANDSNDRTGGTSSVLDHRQLSTITLNGDAEVRAVGDFGMVGSGHANTTLTLNNHILTKTGAGTFIAENTTITEGTVQIDAGTFNSHTTSATDSGKNANLTAADFVVNQNGTFKVTGDNETAKNLTINGGFLVTDGYTLTISDSTVLNGGTLAGNLTAGNITFLSVMQQTTGKTFTLAENATVVIDEAFRLAEGNTTTYIDAEGKDSTSGFIKKDSTGTLLTSSGGNVMLGDGIAATLAGTNVTLNFANGALTYTTTESKTFVVNEDLSYDADTMAGATGFYITAGNTLTGISPDAGDIVLTGSGAYNLGSGNNSMPSGVSLGSGWTGTLIYSYQKKGNDLISSLKTLAGLSSADKLQISGAAGYIANTSDHTNELPVDIILKNNDGTPALTLCNGNSNNSGKFTGKVSGTGDVVFNPNFYSNDAWGWEYVNYEFSGDVSEWTGNIITKNGQTGINKILTIVFSGNATDISANLVNNNVANQELGITVNTGDKFNLKIDNTQDVTLSGTVDVDTLTISNTGKTTFSANVAAGTLNLQQLSGLNGQTVIFGNGDADKVKTTATFAEVSVENGGTATLQLNSDATLNRITTTEGTIIILTGNGVYDLGNSTSTNVSGLDDSSKWTGTVKLSNINAAPDGGFDFDSYGNAQSQVQLSGVKGWIGMNHVDTDTNLHLVNGEGERNYGLNLHATSPKTYQFDGAISGSGDLWVGNEGGEDGSSRTFTFNGDLSAWDGKLVFGADETATVNLNGHAKDGDSGSGITLFSSENGGLKTSTNQTAVLNVNIGTNGYTTTMNGGIVHEGSGNLNLTVKGNTNFKEAVTITNLTTTNNATVEFHADTTVAGNVTAGGTIHVEDGTFTMGGTLNAIGKTLELSGASTGVGQGTEGKTTAKIRLEGTGNTVGSLDFGKNGYARGVLELGESSSTTAGALYMNNGVSISLEKDAALTIGDSEKNYNYTITGRGVGAQIGIAEGDALSEKSLYRGQFGENKDVKYILSNVDVNVNKASADNTLAYELDNSSLTNAGSDTLTVSNANNTITHLAADGGNVTLSASMGVDSISAKSGKTVTVTNVTNGNTIRMEGGVRIGTNGTDATLTAKSDNALLQLQADTSFSISDMTLSGVKISADADTEVVLSNVSAQEVELTSGQFTMANKATVDTGGNTDLLSGITLKNTGASAASLTVDLGNLYSLGVQGKDGKFSLTITLDGFTMESMEYVEGKGLIFAEDSWLAQMLGKEANKGAEVSIQSLNEAVAATQEAAVASTNAVTYNSAPGSNVGTVISITGLSVIPEPATTTLGLVALAALVTRRRRK